MPVIPENRQEPQEEVLPSCEAEAPGNGFAREGRAPSQARLGSRRPGELSLALENREGVNVGSTLPSLKAGSQVTTLRYWNCASEMSARINTWVRIGSKGWVGQAGARAGLGRRCGCGRRRPTPGQPHDPSPPTPLRAPSPASRSPPCFPASPPPSTRGPWAGQWGERHNRVWQGRGRSPAGARRQGELHPGARHRGRAAAPAAGRRAPPSGPAQLAKASAAAPDPAGAAPRPTRRGPGVAGRGRRKSSSGVSG